MTKSLINSERSYAFYIGGLGVIMAISILLNNVPLLHLSNYVNIPFKKEIAGACFLTGSLFGAYAMSAHLARGRTPWSVPQSRVSITFLAFLALSSVALVIAH